VKRWPWVMIVVLGLLVGACGGAEDTSDDDPAVAEEATSTTAPLVSPGPVSSTGVVTTTGGPSESVPTGDGQETPASPVMVFLGDGGQFDGLLTFDSLRQEHTFEGALTIGTLLPSAVIGDSEAYRATVREALAVSIVDEILQKDLQWSDWRGEGQFQYAFGTGVKLTDGSARLIFLGGDETFSELSILTTHPCDGFPIDCTEVSFDGFNMGFAPSVDVGPIIEAGLSGFPADGGIDVTSDSFFWAHRVSGIPDAISGDMMDRLEILSMESGKYADGKMGVKLHLRADLLTETIFQTTTSISVRDDTGSFYSGSFGVVDGGPVASGFCFIGDCPADGSWPGFDAVLDENGVVVFSFDALGGTLNLSADITIDDDPDPESPVAARFYLGGVRLPFGTADLEC